MSSSCLSCKSFEIFSGGIFGFQAVMLFDITASREGSSFELFLGVEEFLRLGKYRVEYVVIAV